MDEERSADRWIIHWGLGVGISIRCLKAIAAISIAIGSVAVAEAADTQAPEAQVLSPTEGSTVSVGQSLVVKATVRDNVAVKSAAIYVSGQLVCLKTAAPYECAYTVPAGATRLFFEVRARDTSENNAETGHWVNVAGTTTPPAPTPVATPQPTPVPTPAPTAPPGVVDTQMPEISVASPAENATVTARSTVLIRVNARDNVGIRDVAIRVGNEQVCTKTAPPYECSWTVPATVGTFFLGVRAHDTSGNNSDTGYFIKIASYAPSPTPQPNPVPTPAATPVPTPIPTPSGGAAGPLPSGTIKILPLGDSITEQGGTTGYRYYLWNNLRATGLSFDFIGQNNDMNQLGYDGNNEGHTGWRAGQIRASLPEWLKLYRPDVVLLHVGTNDLTQLRTAANTAGHVEGIIALLRENNPNVQIVLAQIIPNSTPGADVDGYNALLAPLAARLTTAQSPIKLVDMNTGFSLSWTDGTHPNQTGAQEMGRRWYDALRELWR